MTAKGQIVYSQYLQNGIADVSLLAEKSGLSISQTRVILNQAKEDLNNTTKNSLDLSSGLSLSGKALNVAETHLEQLEGQHEEVMRKLADIDPSESLYRSLLDSSLKLKREIERLTGVDVLVDLRAKTSAEDFKKKNAEKPKEYKQAPLPSVFVLPEDNVHG